MNIAQLYSTGQVNGWLGEEFAREQFKFLSQNFYTINPNKFRNNFSNTGKMMLYECVRKVFGKDTPNVGQKIGDCVSWGYRNAAEQLQACQIILEKKREKFKLLFPPYIYGVSRVLVGRQRSRSDGSTGAWASQAVMKYGVLAEDEKGVPAYSGKVASDWGYSGPPNEFVELGKKHLVKSAALVTTWEQMCTAIGNGYPVAICSDQGFQMMPGRDGFHEASGTWNHCMDVCGFDNNYNEPYCIVMNSWGDSPNVHGELFDFDTKERLPGGCLRVRKRVMSRILSQGDSYALSFMEGFEDTSLERDLFDFVSDWRW